MSERNHDRCPRRGPGRAPGARVGRPSDRARSDLRHRGVVRRHELPQAGRSGIAAVRLGAHEHHRRSDDARWPRQLRLRRRRCAGAANGNRRCGTSGRLLDLSGDIGAPRLRQRRLDARRQLEPHAARPHDEPASRAGPRDTRRSACRCRRRDLHGDEPQLVDRRQAPQLPVRDADRLGDQARQPRPHAARRHVHRDHARLLGIARRGRRARGLAPLRIDELRQGPTGTERARLARRRAGAVSERAGRSAVVSALEVAKAALAAARGEAEAVAHAERSGLVRFAGSEVHQPTLIENLVVTLRVIRDKRAGAATTNRVEGDGLRDLVRRATEAAQSAPVDDSFPGLAPPSDPPAVDGYDEETAQLGADDQARLAAAAIEASGDVPAYGFFTSGVSELAVASTTGLAVEQRMTDATALVVAADDGRSGYAEQTSWRAADVDPAAVAREAAEKAARTKDASEIEPGVYRAVLEPYAFADLLDYFSH